MRVLVCGSRDYADRAMVYAVLDRVRAKHPDLYVIHGGASGADHLASDWAEAAGVPQQEFLARWSEYGRRAGPMRNQRMLEEGKPDAVVAFPGGTGTEDMVRRAAASGLPIWRIS